MESLGEEELLSSFRGQDIHTQMSIHTHTCDACPRSPHTLHTLPNMHAYAGIGAHTHIYVYTSIPPTHPTAPPPPAKNGTVAQTVMLLPASLSWITGQLDRAFWLRRARVCGLRGGRKYRGGGTEGREREVRGAIAPLVRKKAGKRVEWAWGSERWQLS